MSDPKYVDAETAMARWEQSLALFNFWVEIWCANPELA